jgi:hypothetical protein
MTEKKHYLDDKYIWVRIPLGSMTLALYEQLEPFLRAGAVEEIGEAGVKATEERIEEIVATSPLFRGARKD